MVDVAGVMVGGKLIIGGTSRFRKNQMWMYFRGFDFSLYGFQSTGIFWMRFGIVFQILRMRNESSFVHGIVYSVALS
jgi:succinate-acetate transporter protein